MGMNSETSTNEEFYARLGIAPPVKARGIREAMAENAQRAADAQAMRTRLDAAAIVTRAKAL